ncbi:MAG: tetratricopeptide repeat protein [Bacteroidia bacterium]
MRTIVILMCFVLQSSFAQNVNEKLAAQYFADKEYQKAADLYEDLASDYPQSVYYYDNLLQCYIQLKSYKNAEKLIDKRIRKYDELYGYVVDKAYIYDLQGELKKRDEVFDDLYKIKIQNPDQAELLANAFLKRRFYIQSIRVYEDARKSLNNPYIFAFNLSQLYFYNSKLKEGTEELVNIAGENEFVLQDVKTRLVMSYTNADQYKILSTVLLEKLQKNPDNLAYNDLLVWAFTQQKDWGGAFIQTKAVDRRLKEDGKKLFELASILLVNEQYEYALKCFDYVKSLGSDKRYFYQAQQGLLNCGLLQIRVENGASNERLNSMEFEYLDFINTNGTNWQTAQQIVELSELYIYYLHKPLKAIDQLNKFLVMPGVNATLMAQAKLALGDAQLIIGETWEADLLYKQVEKSYTNDALGQEARFKYARLCYFRGDFEWCQTQLDVLKDATTQLISNNAMRLWLIIQDNIGLDSNYEALKLYAEADLLIFQNKYDSAMNLLEEIPILYPGHTLTDEIYYSKAVIAEKQGRLKDAEVFYLKVVRDFSYDILADNALINLARMYEFKLKDTANAKKFYELIVLNYTGSLFANEARKRYRFLRGDLKENEISP